MKLSDLQQALTKVQSIAGDVDVILKAAEGDVETVITDLGIHLDPQTGSTSSSVVVTHGTAPATPDAPPEAEAPTEGEQSPQP